MSGSIQKLLQNVAGVFKNYTPLQASAGAGSAGELVALDSSGKFDASVFPASVSSASVVTATASEAISAGALVNVYSNAGATAVRNADNTAAGKEATGFVTAAIASGVAGTVLLSGENTSLSGLTPGVAYYLGTVGAAVTTPPTAAGSITQGVGEALTATSLMFRRYQPITN